MSLIVCPLEIKVALNNGFLVLVIGRSYVFNLYQSRRHSDDSLSCIDSLIDLKLKQTFC